MPTSGPGRVALLLLAVAAATLVRLALDPMVGDGIPYLTYVIAVLFVARWTDRRTALASIVISCAVADFLFVTPRYSFSNLTHDLAYVAASITFILVGVGIVLIAERMRAAEASALEQREALEREMAVRRRAEDEIGDLLRIAERARDEAEAASRAKDAFLATVSHELRTPLSPILAWSRLLRQGRLDADKTRRALDTIERCAGTQAQLIDDLLDVSRIISGKLRLDVRPVLLAPIVQAAIDVVRPAADGREIRLQAVLDTQAGMVAGDPERLQQIVWNLLSNAIKFTPKGGRVQVVLARVASHVEITVSDTGQGIAPDFLGRLFERFQQADSSYARGHGGLGIGLAIVRHMVEAHGGTVEAASPGLGQGASFTVKLPLMVARPAAETALRPPIVSAPRHEDGALPSLAGLRILVVDDEPDSNEVVSAVLGFCGADVRVAGSAMQAREVLGGWGPDLLVSDIGMPEEDGYAFIAALRASAGPNAAIPAIALTAYASRDDRIRLLSSGFQAHVPKPVDPQEFVAIVANLARTTGRLQA